MSNLEIMHKIDLESKKEKLNDICFEIYIKSKINHMYKNGELDLLNSELIGW